MRWLFAVAVVVRAAVSYAGAPILPEPWRLPTPAELDAPWRIEPDRAAVVSADFDSDGLVDGAFIVFSADGSRYGVVAFLSSKAGPERWFTILDLPHDSYFNLGIRERKPGAYRVYGPDGNDAPKVTIQLASPGFSYFQPESSSTLVLWSPAKIEFEQHSESD